MKETHKDSNPQQTNEEFSLKQKRKLVINRQLYHKHQATCLSWSWSLITETHTQKRSWWMYSWLSLQRNRSRSFNQTTERKPYNLLVCGFTSKPKVK